MVPPWGGGTVAGQQKKKADTTCSNIGDYIRRGCPQHVVITIE
jgi:hypothetical protein